MLRVTDVLEAKTKIPTAKKTKATTGIQAKKGHYYPNAYI